jgi:dTDP-4-amino-4,6-dideoxygalactose transaminase
MRVPFFDFGRQYAALRGELDAAFVACLSAGDLIHREQLATFEREFAAWLGAPHVAGVGSGYDALHLTMRALGIGPGDEVVLPGHTFVGCVSAVVNAGAVPVLADIGPDHALDPDAAAAAIGPRTRALMPVHLNGRMCDMDRLLALARRHSLAVIENAAQATGASWRGAKAGTLGTAGCFSFYPSKLLGAYGDGGAVATADAQLAQRIGCLRWNGEDKATREYVAHGATALLDNLQAALLSVKLPHLERWIDRHRAIAGQYRAGLTGVGDLELPHWPPGPRRDVFQNYVVRSARRDQLRAYLFERGIETLLMWRKPLWRHPALGLGAPALPQCERLYGEMLYLPVHSELDDAQVDAVVAAVRGFFATNG